MSYWEWLPLELQRGIYLTLYRILLQKTLQELIQKTNQKINTQDRRCFNVAQMVFELEPICKSQNKPIACITLDDFLRHYWIDENKDENLQRDVWRSHVKGLQEWMVDPFCEFRTFNHIDRDGIKRLP